MADVDVVEGLDLMGLREVRCSSSLVVVELADHRGMPICNAFHSTDIGTLGALSHLGRRAKLRAVGLERATRIRMSRERARRLLARLTGSRPCRLSTADRMMLMVLSPMTVMRAS